MYFGGQQCNMKTECSYYYISDVYTVCWYCKITHSGDFEFPPPLFNEMIDMESYNMTMNVDMCISEQA